VEAVRRQIAPAMVGATIEAVTLRRPDLRRPFPHRFAQRLAGRAVLDVSRRAKYLLASLSSGDTLLMHLGMSGSFRVARHPSPLDPHDHVVFQMSSGKAVVFNDPRRFGVMDLISSSRLRRYAALGRLGPEPLSRSFDAAWLARVCRGRKTSLKAALLDQRIVAGLGNIYASEALHLAQLSPNRRAATLGTPGGAPRDATVRLAAAIKQVLRDAIARQTGRRYRDEPFLVYDRAGEPCPREHCRGTIRRRTQAGRSTFYCPVCQR
jgi:formamidopyrimidine-DNA glycosylase